MLPSPPALPELNPGLAAVTYNLPTPQPAPQPEFTGTTGKPTDADPKTTGAEPEHTILLQRIRAERDTRDQDILQWKNEALFCYKVSELARDSASG